VFDINGMKIKGKQLASRRRGEIGGVKGTFSVHAKILYHYGNKKDVSRNSNRQKRIDLIIGNRTKSKFPDCLL